MCRRAILALMAVAVVADAQWQLNRSDSEKVNRVLQAGIHGDALKCSVKRVDPFLDFAFRFETGYVLSCPVKDFDGLNSSVISYLRITPEGQPPVFLANGYRLPAIPPELAKQVNIKKLRNKFEMSGAFVLGQGQFRVDFLAVDNLSRIYQTHWTLKAKPGGRDQNVPLAIPNNTASAFPDYSWNGKACDTHRAGSRLTVLLDAAPMYPNASKLYAWDRAFLLGALSSLLRGTPAESVRLIAFNLDQQRIIFRQDHFDSGGFRKLTRALQTMELRTVSYKTLQHKNGWAELLARLVNEQITGPHPPDSVIFLGPTNRISEKVPETMFLPRTPASPQFFYFEYFPFWRSGAEFADAIQHVTHACEGTTIKIHSPGEFAEAIKKVNERLAAYNRQSRSVNDSEMAHNGAGAKR